MAIRVASALETEHEKVHALSLSMSLDMEDFRISDFLTAKQGGNIIGFGRLRTYPGFREVASVGVLAENRGKGIGSLVVNELIRQTREEIYLTCVIPGFFSKLGFEKVKDFPSELIPKYDFCRSFGYSEEEVTVMKYKRSHGAG